ncbi:MAG: hypothetical protein A2511_10130 [Deltaproteobacteria bacterium RIFOXYD12_FULL_50_9]|nr:MAG: hypothetical protein A2511_10130 [Deltaproteobacteria bacterium RIFOXYD12_FULL_50_9]
MIYIDTSILAAYYCLEPLSDIVEAKLMEVRNPAISLLTEIELASAISRKIREGNLSREAGNRIINQFQAHIAHHLFRLLPIEHEHYQQAKAWIAQFNTPLRTLDALHLALAATENATLLTSDGKLAQAAIFFGVDVSVLSTS